MTEPTMEDVLSVLETISEQQTAISNQLAELLAVLTQSPEISLIDELAGLLSELLMPLTRDMAEIKARLGLPGSGAGPTA